MIVTSVWLVVSLLTTLLTLALHRRAKRAERPKNQPPCVVLSPVKGASANLPAFVEALLHQDYPRYRVVFIVESADDPACAVLSEASSRSDGRAVLLIAGLATDRGQKVQNLAAGLKAVGGDDEIVAFVDADCLPPSDWLMQLTRQIARGRSVMSSGYLVLVPHPLRPASVIASLMSLGLATCPSPISNNFCWGGSTAVLRKTLEGLQPQKYFANTLSDDLALSRAARDGNVRLDYVVAVRVPTPADYSWRSFFAYVRRQYMILRIYALSGWAFAAVILLLPVVGTAAAAYLVVSGHPLALAALIAIWLSQQLRYVIRTDALRRVLDPAVIDQLAPIFRIQHLLGPCVHLIHVLAFLPSMVGRTITWADITYRILGPDRMTVLRRSPAESQRRANA